MVIMVVSDPTHDSTIHSYALVTSSASQAHVQPRNAELERCGNRHRCKRNGGDVITTVEPLQFAAVAARDRLITFDAAEIRRLKISR